MSLLFVIALVMLEVPGVGAQDAALSVEKYISLDGGATWNNASAAPGPQVELGAEVTYKVVVTNSGGLSLTNIVLKDSQFDTGSCVIPATLAPAAFFECEFGPVAAEAGQHTNVATAEAAFEGGLVSASDTANYFGGDQPAIDVEKYVSLNGGAIWFDADSAPGPQAITGAAVSFKFVVTNQGSRPLTGITLTDDTLDLSGCAVPDTLDPQAGFECVVGPVPATEVPHVNTATVSAVDGDVTVTDTDQAHYTGGGEELPVVIVIEGPVESININIIVIYGMEIELDPDDPILLVLKIGDWVRLEGGTSDDGDVTIIVAVTVVIINVNVYINTDDDSGWREDSDCQNPPPPWAPAWGWRRKCEGVSKPGK
jgi:uncharacterized repeat protein (TIGR01451 family)